ncbi:hypothetical protein [Gluconobacter japonicus]|uniref:hypothetical protein n=1 Tax=Gluconobacter japonicus TaxID=376620 RepID=UPI001B8B2DB7|nr:hypothetical protein [Gluconobacter japonicus]MBS1051143.1 hypothetical protein [Gluconobacter japonicus]
MPTFWPPPRNRLLSLLAYALFALLGASPASAKSHTPTPTQIPAIGTVTLKITGADTKVTATLVTATTPSHSIHLCSGGRTTCSPVEKLSLTVGRTTVYIPDSLVATLSDVNSASLSAYDWTQFVLTLDCGDAAAATQVRIRFDKNRVLEREVIAGEAGIVSERTTYEDLSGAFN